MAALRLDDESLIEIMTAARLVPVEARGVFLERVAAALHGEIVGAGKAHRVAFAIAQTMTWDLTKEAS